MLPRAEWLRRRAQAHLLASAEVLRATTQCLPAVLAAADLLAATFASGGKLLLCGNGGSAAQCQHLAAEFVGRLTKEVVRCALPAIALTADTALLTACANDHGYATVFARQVEALGAPGDALLAISASGSSPNVVHAVEAACAAGLCTIALTGEGGQLRERADIVIAVPSMSTQHIQEAHLALGHVLCDLVEQHLFGAERTSLLPAGMDGRA
jgi:D-sedoheptulose 7-phosphate isomerase